MMGSILRFFTRLFGRTERSPYIAQQAPETKSTEPAQSQLSAALPTPQSPNRRKRAASPAEPARLRLAAVIDVETTGLSSEDEVIELAISLIEFHSETYLVTRVIDSYTGRREPSVPINPFAR